MLLNELCGRDRSLDTIPLEHWHMIFWASPSGITQIQTSSGGRVMTADGWEVAGCLQRPKGSENGKSQAIENGVRTLVQNLM